MVGELPSPLPSPKGERESVAHYFLLKMNEKEFPTTRYRHLYLYFYPG
jgi:hypothetical protein